MENRDGCVKNDDLTLAGDSDLNFAVEDIEKVYGYVDENKFERRDDFNEDLNEHGQHNSEPLAEKSYPVSSENHDTVIETKFVHDRGRRTQSPFKDDNHYQGEMDELHGNNFINPSSQSKLQTFHNETGTEDSAHSQGVRKESSFDMQSLKRTAGGSISPTTKRQMSVSPEGSASPHRAPYNHECLPSHQGSQSLSYGPRLHSQKGVSPDNLYTARRTSSLTHGIRHRSQHSDSSAKHINTSPRYHRSLPRSHRSPPDYRRRDRSESRSPIRHRDSYGYKRVYRERSRSRSPYSRANHRSTRGRHSPRRRLPIPEYHSHRQSVRRKRWSPPPNRKTGLGKPGRNLFVAGFSFVTTEKDLERKFSRYGRVRDVRIVRDKRSGDSRGFGFLTLETDEDADAAIRSLDETEWNGRIILVEKSKT